MDELASVEVQIETAKTEHARDLQARLYREIGISAVAAALRFTTQPEPGTGKAVANELPPLLRETDIAA